jgi:hypothetical protein
LTNARSPSSTNRGARSLAGGLLVLASLAGGCLEATPPPVKGVIGEDSGFATPPTPDASTSSADAGADDAAPAEAGDGGAAAWAGTWTFTSGSQGVLCGGNLAVIAVSGFLDITPSSSGTLLTVVEDGCSFHFDLAGEVATEEPEQACAAWSVPTIPIWTLTMQADGTLREMLGGTVYMSGERCTISGGSTLVRQ